MKLSNLILALVLFMYLAARAQVQQPGTFVAGDNTFLLNGKPYVVRAGELHFPRIPREYWEQRIQMCKAMGMNTICIYLFWNFPAHNWKRNKSGWASPFPAMLNG